MDLEQAKEFAAMVDSVRARHGEIVSDHDPDELDRWCNAVQYWLSLLNLAKANAA